MRVIFSDHANLKIEQRKLSREKILKTVNHPDFRKSSYGLREELFRHFGKNHLKVVVVREVYALVVVTAHWVARPPKKQ